MKMKKEKNIIIIIISFAAITVFVLLQSRSNVDSFVVDTVYTAKVNVLNEINSINQDSTLKFPTNFKVGEVKNKKIKLYPKQKRSILISL